MLVEGPFVGRERVVDQVIRHILGCEQRAELGRAAANLARCLRGCDCERNAATAGCKGVRAAARLTGSSSGEIEMSASNSEPAQCAPPHLDVRKPTLKLPPKAADCHAHVFGPRDKYPYAPTRLYMPPPVTLDDYLEMHDTVGIARGVLVQTGLYGNDNSFIVDAIKAHPNRLRGIALIGEDITDRELRHLADNGVRGFRVNRTARTGLAFDIARKLADRSKELGWHVQFLLDVEDHPDLDTMLGTFATEVVIDHMGRPDPAKGVNAPGFQALIRLLKSGRGWAKLSAPYRTSLQEPPYSDLAPFAHALVAAAPGRLVWGSDWPHVLLEKTMPNDGDLVDQIAVWVPDETARNRIFVDNAEKLYGFERA
jgi:predicted TIM-barrel fold metal-dependent hydrolase